MLKCYVFSVFRDSGDSGLLLELVLFLDQQKLELKDAGNKRQLSPTDTGPPGDGGNISRRAVCRRLQASWLDGDRSWRNLLV